MTDAARVLSAWLKSTESSRWLALAAASRTDLSKAGASSVIVGTHAVLARLGAITLRLLALHLTWGRVPGGSAKDYLQPSRLLADPLAHSLSQAFADALAGMSDPITVDRARLRQLVGSVVVCGGYGRLIDEVRGVQAQDDRLVDSYKQALQEFAAQAGLAPPAYRSHWSGPPHDPVHHAEVRCDGRLAGPAEGSTKRATEDAAARLWLEEHAAGWLTRPRDPTRARGCPVTLPQHARAILEIREKLSLPPSVEGWLSAALSDRAASTTPEEHRVASSGLAQLGADVLSVSVLRALVHEAAQGRVIRDSDLIRNELLTHERLADQLRRSQLAGAHLPSPTGTSARRQADAVQGVAAVTLVAEADPSLAAEALVSVGIQLTSDLRMLLTDQRDALLHPKSALQELADSLGVEVQYGPAETRGPSHTRVSRARLTLVATSGERLDVPGPWAETRSAAERQVCELVSQTLTLKPEVLDDGVNREIATFLLRHGAEHLRREPAFRRGRGLLPLLRAWRSNDWTGVAGWLNDCEQLTDAETQAAFGKLLTRTIERAGPIGAPSVVEKLQDVMDIVSTHDTEADQPILGGELETCLLHLMEMLSLFRYPRRRWSLAQILEEVQVGQASRHRLAISGDLTPQIIERAGTTRTLMYAALRRADAHLSWTLNARRTGRLVMLDLSTAGPLGEDVPVPFQALLRGDMPLVDVRAKPNGIELTWVADPPEALDAVLLSGGPVPMAQTLASRLHDLKNALATHDAALAGSAATPTDRRRRQLDASTHLDAAREILQLVPSSGGMRAFVDDEELVDLGALLNGYLMQLAVRRPPNVVVVLPVLPTVEVTTSPSLLRSLLDNLVKNALEAMPDGGHLRVTLRTSPTLCIRVADTGGGIDPGIVERIRCGEAAPSSKRGGPGEGLATVLTYARRLGARLDVETRPAGTDMILEMAAQ